MADEVGKTEKTSTGLRVKADPKRLESEARNERIKERKVNPKANPTNREVMDAINDLHGEIADLKDLLNK